MQDRNLVLDALKGLAIVLVIYGHVIQRSMVVNGQDFFLNPAFKIIYTFHLPLFVFISGYLMFFSLRRRSAAEVFIARCQSLLVPCIAWGILGIFTIYALNAIDGKAIGIDHFPRDLFEQLILNPAVWFLFTLFVISSALLCAVQWEKQLGVLSYAVVYLLIMAIPGNDYCSLYYIKWFLLFYWAGYFVSRSGIKITHPSIRKAALIFSWITFGILVSYWTKNDYIYVNKMSFGSGQYVSEIFRLLYRYVLGFLGIFIVFEGVQYFARADTYVGLQAGKVRPQIKLVQALAYLGVYSLDIYLLQRYVVEGIYPRIFSSLHITLDYHSFFVLGVVAPLLAVMFVAFCAWISRVLIRRTPWVSRLLLGR